MVPTDSAPIIGPLSEFSEQPSTPLVDRRRQILALLRAEVALRPEDRPIGYMLTAAGVAAIREDC